MNSKVQTIKIGNVGIDGPTSTEKRCYIVADLAELFGCEFTSEAVDILKYKWKSDGKKAKLEIDAEADSVLILVSKNAVVELAATINHLSIGHSKLEEKLLNQVLQVVKKWKQPEAYSWKVGDVFAVKLSKTIFAYGQVLAKSPGNAPTCVLFSHKTIEQIESDIQNPLDSRPIAILHVQEDQLNDQLWIVIGNSKPILHADSGPCGVRGEINSIEWDGLEILAKAWHCISPWNTFYKDDYLDKYLLNGVLRPAEAILYKRKELENLGIKRPEWK